MKSAKLHILFGGLLLVATWLLWPAAEALQVCMQQAGQTDGHETTCCVLSYPAERPFAIEQHSPNMIVPSVASRHWTMPHSQGTINALIRPVLVGRKQVCINRLAFGISLPPEQIAFPFSAFW